MIEFALFLATGMRLGMPWWYFFLAFVLLIHRILMFAYQFVKEASKSQ